MPDPLANTHCAVFDFDGTLAPNLDLPDMRRQVVSITQQFQVPAEVYADCMIVEVIHSSTQWLQLHRPTSAAAYEAAAQQRIVDIELAAAADTEVFAAARPLLLQLRQRGCKTAIVTRNCRAAVLQTFADALQHCDLILARDDVTHLKPDPRHVQAALTRVEIAPQHAAMVGDGRLDMQVGRALQMQCIGVLSGSSDTQALTAAGADVVLHSIANLLT